MENNNIKKMTIIRTAVLIVALINQTLTMSGNNPLPFSDEEIYNGVTSVVTVLASLWTWWKDNPFTKKARKANAYFDELKKEEA